MLRRCARAPFGVETAERVARGPWGLGPEKARRAFGFREKMECFRFRRSEKFRHFSERRLACVHGVHTRGTAAPDARSRGGRCDCSTAAKLIKSLRW